MYGELRDDASISEDERGKRMLALALALEKYASEEFGQVDNTFIDHVFDDHDLTEGLRRLPGFLAFVSGILKPLLRPAEEEREPGIT
jgi:hypothetical protein